MATGPGGRGGGEGVSEYYWISGCVGGGWCGAEGGGVLGERQAEAETSSHALQPGPVGE